LEEALVIQTERAWDNNSMQPVPLLATKLFAPSPPPDLVVRQRLLDRLEVGLRGPLTLLVAPAGWGKTTVLSSWCGSACARPPARTVAWVALDAGDNDPVRFWTYALTALERERPGVAAGALASLLRSQPLIMEVALTALLNAVAASPEDVVLVLDDFHVIQAEAVHNSLTFLLERLPPQLHLLIANREDPPFPLARRRAHGGVTEIRVADLRFTSEETAEFLATRLGVALSNEDVAALEARSEGWIAALQLAALSLQDRSPQEVERFIAAFTGSNRYVVDYLTEEVLTRQPPEMQDFLVRTAVLDRFCAPLCERLLADGEPNANLASGEAGGESSGLGGQLAGAMTFSRRTTAQALLEQVERANLFLIPLDDERRWYRYHHLFADALRSRLREWDPTLYAALYEQASAWCEEQGLVEEAVKYALAARAVTRAADLIERHALAVGASGQAETVLGWLRALPEPLTRERPILGAIHAVTLFLSGATAEAMGERLRAAEAAVAATRQAGALEAEPHPIAGTLALVRALVAVQLGDLQTSVALAQEALELLPRSGVVWRAMTQVLVDQAYALTGDVTPPVHRALSESYSIALAAGNRQLAGASLLDLGHVEQLQGRLRTAAATYERAVRTLPEPLPLEDAFHGPGCAFGLGDVWLEWNDFDEAERSLTRGIQLLTRWAVPARTVARGYMALARLHQARRDPAGVTASLDAFSEVAERRGFFAVWRLRSDALRAQLQLAQGDLDSSTRWVESCGLSATDDTLPFLYEPAYLALARIRIAQGRMDPGGPLLVEALRLLERLRTDAEAKGRGRTVLETLILSALAQDAHKDARGALGTLAHALELAQLEGYVRLFADEGAPMAHLLITVMDASSQKRIVMPDAALAYVRHLLEVLRSPDGEAAPSHGIFQAPAGAPRDVTAPPLLDPLTAREVDVLRLLAEGDTNAAIAEKLVVTVGTVKKHVFHISSKLGVQNRTQAVARARALRLF
jgi:LuxR family maltose regulon positive regulatory protein